jgi:hypothetical protein
MLWVCYGRRDAGLELGPEGQCRRTGVLGICITTLLSSQQIGALTAPGFTTVHCRTSRQ